MTAQRPDLDELVEGDAPANRDAVGGRTENAGGLGAATPWMRIGIAFLVALVVVLVMWILLPAVT